MEDFMSELIMIERNAAVNVGAIQIVAEVENMDMITEDETPVEDTSSLDVDLEAGDGLSGSDIDGAVTDDLDIGSEEGYIEEGFDEGLYEEGLYEEGYMDPGFFEEGYMETGTEMGMPGVKDPLLSSWPFVIGISAAVLVVSIVLGALLAKLKIKKGIDLYED